MPAGGGTDDGSGPVCGWVPRLVIYAAVLFASFAFNALGVRSGLLWYSTDPRTGYHGLDSALVLSRLRLAADGGHALHPLADEPTPGKVNPYPSQFGLQGVVLSAVMRALDAEPGPFAAAAALGCSLLTALTLAVFFASVARRFRPAVGDVAVAVTASAPVLVQLAPSLYWCAFLLFAPFVAAWVLSPWAAAGPRSRKAVFLAVVGSLVLVKSLCGYEFITTVTLAPTAAVWFHQHATGHPLRTRLRWAAAAVLAGLLGFGAALGLHAAQLRLVLGVDPMQSVMERAKARTVANDGRDEVVRTFDRTWARALPDRLAYPANCFLDYFRQPVASAPAVWTRRCAEVSLGQAALAALACGVVFLLGRLAGGERPGRAAALLGATVIALMAAVSWQVLAVNHMCVHQHLNLVVFQLTFLPLAAILLGVGVAALADRLRCGRAVGPLLLAVGLATATVTLTKADARAAAEPAEQARAADAVLRYLASGVKPHPGGLAGHAERVDDIYRLHHTHRVELGLTTMTEPADRREPVLVVSGWAVDYEAVGRVPSARVVVTVGGKPVAARVVRYGLPHLDKLLGGRRLPIGFAAIIRTADAPPGSELRVFAVSAADPGRVLELSPLR